MPKPACKDELVMVLVVVGHLQKRSALQAEKTDHFELRKTTAGLLVAILWPLELVGSGIWHRQTGTINNFDPPAQPELLVGDLAFELPGHLGANLLEHSLIEPCASLTVAAGITGRRTLVGKVHLPPSTNSLQGVTTGGAAFQDLSQKGPEGNQGTKDALAAIDLLLGATEQSLGDKLTKSLRVLVDGGPVGPLAN